MIMTDESAECKRLLPIGRSVFTHEHRNTRGVQGVKSSNWTVSTAGEFIPSVVYTRDDKRTSTSSPLLMNICEIREVTDAMSVFKKIVRSSLEGLW